MLDVIKDQLLKIIDDIDCGNSELTEEEALNTVKLLKKYTRKDTPMSKVQAYTYLGVSRATFDNLVKEGKIPKGRKQVGFKELFFSSRENEIVVKRPFDL